MKGKKISITFRCKLIPNIPSCQQAQLHKLSQTGLFLYLWLLVTLSRFPNFPTKASPASYVVAAFMVGFRHSQCLQQKIPHSSYQSSHHFPSLSPLPLQSIPALLMSPAKIISFNLAALPHLKFNFYPVIFSLNSSSFRKIYNKNHFIIYFTLF